MGHEEERDVGSRQGGAEAVGCGLDGALQRRRQDDRDLVIVRKGLAEGGALRVAERSEVGVAEVVATLQRVSFGE